MSAMRQGHSKKAIDEYTLAHVATGMVLGGVGVPPWEALAMSVFWEIAEQPMKKRIPSVFPIPELDTAANSAIDTVAWMAGWFAGNSIRTGRQMISVSAPEPRPRRFRLFSFGPGSF